MSTPDPVAAGSNGNGVARGLPVIAPDSIEQERGEEIDNIVPSYGYQETPMVGIGGSAGAIRAMQTFFEKMPADSGMVFVVILHLSPDHASTMAEMIQRWTGMRVLQAEDEIKAEVNTVYVIPPGKHLTSTDGHLKLTDLNREQGRRVAVDLFFRSLADTHGSNAIAVVLSGADGDGTLGIKRIKERGGLTIAQDPDEAEHNSMPRGAIDTGMVDWVLPTVQMPERILSYVATARRLKLPPEEGPQPTHVPPPALDQAEAALREVLIFLRMRTGRDFSYYKRATILRRLSRRMQVNGVEDLPQYLAFLRLHPGEAGALLKDLLISVTNFFRDRDCFTALQSFIPGLFEGKGHGDTVRVWVPGCATGEEAYSIAIMLIEHARMLDMPPALQVFGCDLAEDAVQTARSGLYPDAITADVSEERLRAFFIKEHHGYRVRREVREIVLFAAHDLLRDAPFSRLDLISCRNLLIYLNREAQSRVFEIFHFALKPEGRLFLGSSDSIEDGSMLFTPLDKKYRIYSRRAAVRVGLPIPTGPSHAVFQQLREHAPQERTAPAGAPVVTPGLNFAHSSSLAEADARAAIDRDEEHLSWNELHFKMIEHLAPPSILVNTDHDIQHLSESAGRFLQVVGGQPTTNLLRLVNPALRIELRAALFRATQTGEKVEVSNVPMELESRPRSVDIRVSPVKDLAPDFLLVSFDAHDPDASQPEVLASALPEPIVTHLERELEQVKGYLRNTVEQYEVSTEELKASNEELQAMNEELRSATEELETSREELQSINEELTTVNQELKGKVDELGHANSDLQNLMGATAIATVFLDRNMRVMRFTNSATPIFNLIPGDLGRPLADLQHRIDYPEMADDARRVLETLVTVEREVNGFEGRTYLARTLPYRTLEDRIAGVVLTFVDITERQQNQAALRVSDERLRLLIESARDYAIFSITPERSIATWNPGAEAMFGYIENEILGRSGDILFTPEDREHGDPEREAVRARDEDRVESERWHIRKDGSRFYGSGSVTPLRDKTGALIGFLKIMRDLTERQETTEAMREQVEELTRFNRVAVGRESRMVELKQEINKLSSQLGQPPRYSIDLEKTDGHASQS